MRGWGISPDSARWCCSSNDGRTAVRAAYAFLAPFGSSNGLRLHSDRMEAEELLELREHAKNQLQRQIGVTMAVFAAFLAVVTLMGHRLHTEEVVLQTRLADQWAYYQAKN